MAVRAGRHKQATQTKTLKVGDQAPDFTLPTHHGHRDGARSDETFTLSSFRGQKHVVIAFFPLAFTPV